MPIASEINLKVKVARQINRSDILFCQAQIPGSDQWIVGNSDALLHQVDLGSDKGLSQAWAAAHAGYVTGLVWAAGQVISGAYDGKLIWWDIEKRSPVRTVPAHAKWIRDLAVSTDGSRIASVADDMVCRLWDPVRGTLLHELKGHQPRTPHHFPSMLYACTFSQDGSLLATADKLGHVVIWDVASGRQLATCDAPLMYTWDPKQRIHSIGGVRSLAFSPDGALLAAGGIGQIGNIDHLGAMARLEVFQWKKGQRTHEFAGDTHKGLFEKLRFHPQGTWLMGAGGDHGGFFKFFDLNTKKILTKDKAPMHIHDFQLNDNADGAVAVGHGKIVVWEIAVAS